MSGGGAIGSENVGMSSDNKSEKLLRRKTKVSWATVIVPGLVGPKQYPNGERDGQQVNIPVLSQYRSKPILFLKNLFQEGRGG